LPNHLRNTKPLEVLHFLRQYGFHELALNYSERLAGEDEYWFQDSAKAKQFVAWFNTHFELTKPLSAKEVVAKDSSFDSPMEHQFDAFDPHYFKVATIQASGIGRVIDPENWGLDSGFFAAITELAGDKLHVQSHDITDEQHIPGHGMTTSQHVMC